MHLLRTKPGATVDETEAVDLGQTPGDIVFLSAADTELASVADARATFGEGFPAVRLASLMHLAHPMSVDLYTERVIARAKLVVARVLGGAGYWTYGVEQLVETCRAASIPLALLPGDDQPDPELAALGTVPAEVSHRLWQYCVHGGPANSRNLLACAADLVGHAIEWREPAPLPRAGLHWPASARAASTTSPPGGGTGRRPRRRGPSPASSSTARTCRRPMSPPSMRSCTRSRRAACTRCPSTSPASRTRSRRISWPRCWNGPARASC